MTLTIKTDSKPRPVLGWFDLTPREQGEFDYLDSEDRRAEAEFVRYKGQVYDLHDMERGWGSLAMPEGLGEWDNYLSDSYLSGIVIRWVQDDSHGQMVICGTYFS